MVNERSELAARIEHSQAFDNRPRLPARRFALAE